MKKILLTLIIAGLFCGCSGRLDTAQSEEKDEKLRKVAVIPINWQDTIYVATIDDKEYIIVSTSRGVAIYPK